jgi:hypothetical protein
VRRFFLTAREETRHGRDELRQELAPLAAKPSFQFDIRQVIRAGDIALMATR